VEALFYTHLNYPASKMTKFTTGLSVLCLIAVAFIHEAAGGNILNEKCENSRFAEANTYVPLVRRNMTICVYVEDKGYYTGAIRLWGDHDGSIHLSADLHGFGRFLVDLGLCDGTSIQYDCFRIVSLGDLPYPENDMYFTKTNRNSSYTVAHPCVDNELQSGFVEFYKVPSAEEMIELQTEYGKNVTLNEVRKCVVEASRIW